MYSGTGHPQSLSGEVRLSKMWIPSGVARCRWAGAGVRPGQVLPAPELARLAGRQVPVSVAAPAAGGRWGWVWEGSSPPWQGQQQGAPASPRFAQCSLLGSTLLTCLLGLWGATPDLASHFQHQEPCRSLRPAGKEGVGKLSVLAA